MLLWKLSVKIIYKIQNYQYKTPKSQTREILVFSDVGDTRAMVIDVILSSSKQNAM